MSLGDLQKCVPIGPPKLGLVGDRGKSLGGCTAECVAHEKCGTWEGGCRRETITSKMSLGEEQEM